jgi:hypothetical protein
MGGFGSGRRPQPAGERKTVVHDCLCIDINRLDNAVHLSTVASCSGIYRCSDPSGHIFEAMFDVDAAGPSGPWVRLSYSLSTSSTRDEQPCKYRVCLTTTPQRLGGRGWWFICPLIVRGQRCKRRVGKLYLPPGRKYFGCRQCYGLTYRSSQESHRLDNMNRAMGQFIQKMQGQDIPLRDGRWSTW